MNPSRSSTNDDSAGNHPAVRRTSAGPTASPSEESLGSEYLLVCQVCSISLNQGSWHFALESCDGTPVFEAEDTDIGDLNRLTLLAAVRGLESIDGAASVTLLSNNRYLIRSLSDSLPRWRENNFVWEHFGRRMEVQHADLWRRIDRALSIHRVQACLISSRLVSDGGADRRTLSRNSGAQNGGAQNGGAQSGRSVIDNAQIRRVDSPHATTGPNAPRSTALPAQDRLRRWLLGADGGQHAAAPKRRFTSADLLDDTPPV